MDYFLVLLVGAAVGIVLAIISALLWVYDPDDLPPLRVIFEHMRGLRTMIRILRFGSDALSQMSAEARRYR